MRCNGLCKPQRKNLRASDSTSMNGFVNVWILGGGSLHLGVLLKSGNPETAIAKEIYDHRL